MIGSLSYEEVLAFAQSWGAVYFIFMFIAAVAYAFWPSNRQKFRDAASMPLNEHDAAP